MTRKKGKFTIGALVTIIVVVALGAVSVWAAYSALTSSAPEQAVGQKDLTDFLSQQHTVLTAPAAWVDKGKQQVSLPIERAMQVVADELQRNPASATPPEPDAGAKTSDAGPGEATAVPADASAAGSEGENGERTDQDKKATGQDKKAPDQHKPDTKTVVPAASGQEVKPTGSE
jgi:hypothetical protein